MLSQSNLETSLRPYTEFSALFSTFLTELSKGKDNLEQALQKKSELVELLQASPADDTYLEPLLLMAEASEFLRGMQGKNVLFNFPLDRTIDFFHEWRSESLSKKELKPLSSEVCEYVDNARILIQKVFWFLIDTDTFSDITEDELHALSVKNNRIKDADPENNDCGFLFYTLMDLFTDLGSSPDDILRIYFKIKYIS